VGNGSSIPVPYTWHACRARLTGLIGQPHCNTALSYTVLHYPQFAHPV
jgi:hypothetical protein